MKGIESMRIRKLKPGDKLSSQWVDFLDACVADFSKSFGAMFDGGESIVLRFKHHPEGGAIEEFILSPDDTQELFDTIRHFAGSNK